MNLPEIYFFIHEDGRFVVESDDGEITLLYPDLDRNEIKSIRHATSKERAEDWLAWLKEGTHAGLDREILPELDHVKVVCYAP